MVAHSPDDDAPVPWFVYVLVSKAGNRTYVGITTEPERRLAQHNGELPGGARSTHAGRPWQLGRVLGPYPDRSYATRLERVLKARSGARRLRTDVEQLERLLDDDG